MARAQGLGNPETVPGDREADDRPVEMMKEQASVHHDPLPTSMTESWDTVGTSSWW